MPPPMGGIGLSSFGSSVIVASVVNNSAATDAAFSKATRTTLVGSMMPAAYMSQYSSVLALKQNAHVHPLTFATTT